MSDHTGKPTISVTPASDGFDPNTSTQSVMSTTNTQGSSEAIPNSVHLLDEPKIKAILIADNSLEILLAKLKDSIRSCDEFSNYLKRKHTYEESYISNLRKTSVNCKNSVKSNNKVVKGSFIESLDRIISFDDRIVKDVRTPYVKALSKMYDELVSLSSNFHRLRKQMKDEGIRKEKEVIDAIQLAEKSKSKYYSLCNDLEKLRNSDQTSKKITLQGRKTGSQQEEELTRKIQSADQDYNKKANLSQKLKNNLIDKVRPNLSKTLQDLILEIDNALQLQLSKFAVFNESLVIGMGNQLIPISSKSQSMKSVSISVDIEKALYDYLKNSKLQKKAVFIPIQYNKHPLFNKTPFGAVGHSSQPSQNHNKSVSSTTSQAQASLNKYNNSIAQPGKPIMGESILTTTTSNTYVNSTPAATPTLPNQSNYLSLDPRSPVASAPSTPALNGPRAFDTSRNMSADNLSINSGAANGLQSAGLVFGKPLDSIPHDEEMVPLFVKRCIALIEAYGQHSEGIYRSSPNKAKLEELKYQIDNDPHNLQLLDPPDPNNVTNDYVFVLASLLKRFFNDLPDPLLTHAQSESFFKTGQIENQATLRVQLHRIVFELPDANYFTLRDLLFHFYNISQIPQVRMSVKNIAIVWAHNLLGHITYSKQDLSVQQRVIEELILAAHDIFNPKEDD